MGRRADIHLSPFAFYLLLLLLPLIVPERVPLACGERAGLSSSFSSYAMAVYSLWTKDRSNIDIRYRYPIYLQPDEMNQMGSH